MQIGEHNFKSQDKDLKLIADTLGELLSLLEISIAVTCEAIENPQQNLVEKIAKQDAKINKLDHSLEQQVTLILAKKQSKAFDLRFIVASLKVASNIERIGDKCKSIVKKIAHLDTKIEKKTSHTLLKMLKIAQKMAENAVAGFNEQDSNKANLVLNQDDEIDAIYESLSADAEAGKIDVNQIQNIINILFIAKGFERMADHATNIAELTKYVITGEIVE